MLTLSLSNFIYATCFRLLKLKRNGAMASETVVKLALLILMDYHVPTVTEEGRSVIRETREGWLLLIVETDVNGDSKSTNEGAIFVVLVVPIQETLVQPWLL